MSKLKVRGIITVLVLGITIFLTACSGATPKSADTSTGDAKATGKILLYTSQPDQDAQALVDAFTKKYSGTTVEIFRSGTEEVISKLMAEEQAGAVQADVLLVADAVTFERLKEQGLLLSYKSPELTKIPKEYVDENGMYTGTKIISTALVINTKNASTMPDSWKVLTAKESKGQSIMPSPLYSGAAAYNVGVLTRQKDFGWDYYKALKDNDITVTKGNGSVLKTVAAGEKTYGMIVDYMAARAKKEGSPVELVYPKEGVPAITEPVGIVKGTKNEATAKAFVDFVLSEEGQQLAVEMGYTPIREGVNAPEGLKSVKEMKVITADIQELYKARDEDKKQFEGIFGQ
ncbi:ABC transporter substrate-binding protein [Petroclostridium sp. X23]|uniref:ABC transporter substrate-binding protein n=1 Tax=Petroclostridium sp. X23 TaxID=3045146 RepID=UPI0024ACCC68|nr:ABC transporter substrate-binding protein [Petroclostridium sp. X23]WHH58757.1 ABC transporter substrate-binding protein [Petroclostridium sp. X23]